MSAPILTLELHHERDVVLARQRARQIAGLLGFDQQDQTRIATAVSEVARNAFMYAGGGRVEFAIAGEPPALTIRITDRGHGVRDLHAVLSGRYQSHTGMGLGILGAKRLMDAFDIQSSHASGTTVTLGKYFPRRVLPPGPEDIGRIADALARQRPSDPIDEIQQQNQELLRTLDELRAQTAELEQVNRELEETNRGVVALYAELDERADYLQRANEIKSCFLSHMTHEFRTPLNSITSLTRILLLRLDGDLTAEQEKQIAFIAKAAGDLSELVDDLLDLAKVEAGKILVRSSQFNVSDLFAALRGMLRPLLVPNTSLSLIFDKPAPDIVMHTDESKVSQILRNFISNALKFTEQGEVRVSASRGPGHAVTFSVTDTGIGIAPEDREHIFEEYAQIDSALQRRLKGTGLGLSLSRKLAGLLGGSVHVDSEVGHGSTFHAIIPASFQGPEEAAFVPAPGRRLAAQVFDQMPGQKPGQAPGQAPQDALLIIDDDEASRYILRGMLAGTRLHILEASNGWEGLQRARQEQPRAIILDLVMPRMDGFTVLDALKADSSTRDIPVIVHTSKPLTESDRARLSAAVTILSKGSPSRHAALTRIHDALLSAGLSRPTMQPELPPTIDVDGHRPNS